MSGGREELEEVDVFGRTKKLNDQAIINTGTVHAHPNANTQNNWQGNNDNWNERGRGRTMSRDPMPYDDRNQNRSNRQYPPQEYGRNEDRRFERPRSPPHHGGYRQPSPPRHLDIGGGNQRGQNPPRHGTPNQPTQDLNLMPSVNMRPMMSFKSFVSSQSDEGMSAEAYQRLFDEYHLHYVKEFSESFFHVNKLDEWFRDRYDPSRMFEMEKETSQWGARESAVLKQELLHNTDSAIAAMSLNPIPRASGGNREKSLSMGEQEDYDSSVALTDTSIAGKHLSGHENRSVYLTGIHCKCSKSLLRTAVTEALADIAVPERIIVSQPAWVPRAPRFERNAWVIMPTLAATQLAMQRLRDLPVTVPSMTDGSSGCAARFVVQPFAHSPKNSFLVAASLSYAPRVAADTARALQAAALLDEDRAIPEDSRLASILSEEAVVKHLETHHQQAATDQLDIAIAYLRRVHFVAFYVGRRYRDEAHLLSQASSVSYRSIAYVPLSAFPEHASSQAVTPHRDLRRDEEDQDKAEDHRDTDDSPEKDRLMEEDIDAGKDKLQEAEGSVAVMDDNDTKTGLASSSSSAPPGRKITHNFPMNDRRMEEIIADVKARVELHKSGALTVEEEEAQAILTRQELCFEDIVRKSSKIEAEGKARCCYKQCNKLFKNIEFLCKHFRSKHEYFGLDVMVGEAEAFMRARYEAEDMNSRPLPAIQAEAVGGYELKSVREVLEKGLSSTAGAKRGRDSNNNNNNTRNDSGNFGGRGSDRRHSGGGGGDHYRETRGPPAPPAARSPRVDPTNRRITTYIDVDAPKESIGAVDYGVDLLAAVVPKKRKLVVKKPVASTTTAVETKSVA